jgi:predicted rRNA methylase YqxC with S4 and FtsJ domains
MRARNVSVSCEYLIGMNNGSSSGGFKDGLCNIYNQSIYAVQFTTVICYAH